MNIGPRWEEEPNEEDPQRMKDYILQQLANTGSLDQNLLQNIYQTLKRKQEDQMSQRAIISYIPVKKPPPKQEENQPQNNNSKAAKRKLKTKSKPKKSKQEAAGSVSHSKSRAENQQAHAVDSRQNNKNSNSNSQVFLIDSKQKQQHKPVTEKQPVVITIDKWLKPAKTPVVDQKSQLKNRMPIAGAEFQSRKQQGFEQALKQLIEPARSRRPKSKSKKKAEAITQFKYPRGLKPPASKNTLNIPNQAKDRSSNEDSNSKSNASKKSRARSRSRPATRNSQPVKSNRTVHLQIFDCRYQLIGFTLPTCLALDYAQPLNKNQSIAYEVDSEEQFNDMRGEDVNRPDSDSDDEQQKTLNEDFKKYFVPDGYLSDAEASDRQLHPNNAIEGTGTEWVFTPLQPLPADSKVTANTWNIVPLFGISELPLPVEPEHPQILLDRKYGVKSAQIQACVHGASRVKIRESLTKEFGFDKSQTNNWIKYKMVKKKIAGKVVYQSANQVTNQGTLAEDEEGDQTNAQTFTRKTAG